MSKPKPIYIHIPEPCSQSWDEMIPDADGRHCAHCQKTVIDFTGYSDAALYRYFSKNTGHVCGRFLTTQVDRAISIPYQPYSRLYRMTVALGLVLLFTQTPEMLAQTRPPKVEQNNVTTQSRSDTSTHATGSIEGHVVDDKKIELLNAVIQVYQGGVLKGGSVTDYDGNYMIKPLEPGYYDVLVMSVGFDSVKTTGVTVIGDTTTHLDLSMKIKRNGLTGIVDMIYLGRPMIDQDNPGKTTITRRQYNDMPH